MPNNQSNETTKRQDISMLPLEMPPKMTPGYDAAHFPTQLHLMISEARQRGFEHICSWKPHGRAFQIYDKESFMKEVVPLFFRQSRFGSFQRQLNLYGFIRIARTRGKDRGAYYHPFFLRGRLDLSVRIDRVKSLDLKQKLRQVDPDFYSMKPVGAETEVTNEKHWGSSYRSCPKNEQTNSLVTDGHRTIENTMQQNAAFVVPLERTERKPLFQCFDQPSLKAVSFDRQREGSAISSRDKSGLKSDTYPITTPNLSLISHNQFLANSSKGCVINLQRQANSQQENELTIQTSIELLKLCKVDRCEMNYAGLHAAKSADELSEFYRDAVGCDLNHKALIASNVSTSASVGFQTQEEHSNPRYSFTGYSTNFSSCVEPACDQNLKRKLTTYISDFIDDDSFTVCDMTNEDSFSVCDMSSHEIADMACYLLDVDFD